MPLCKSLVLTEKWHQKHSVNMNLANLTNKLTYRFGCRVVLQFCHERYKIINPATWKITIILSVMFEKRPEVVLVCCWNFKCCLEENKILSHVLTKARISNVILEKTRISNTVMKKTIISNVVMKKTSNLQNLNYISRFVRITVIPLTQIPNYFVTAASCMCCEYSVKMVLSSFLVRCIFKHSEDLKTILAYTLCSDCTGT